MYRSLVNIQSITGSYVKCCEFKTNPCLEAEFWNVYLLGNCRN